MTKSADLHTLPTADELWEEFLTRTPRQPAFRLVKAGSTTNRSGVTRNLGFGSRRLDDLLDANAVIDRYRRGDTVVLQGLQHTNPALARFATNLALDTDHPVQINAYLSPADQRGLDIHFDYHDVFVIQLSGSKRWTVWDRLERTVDPVRAGATVPNPKADELGAPRLELTLTPGDVLYLPRGFPHAAETTHEASDHLTIGLTTITWHRYLTSAMESATSDPAVRASLPLRLLDENPDSVGADKSLSPLRPLKLGDITDPARFRHWLARQVWRRMPQTRLRPRVVPGLDQRPLALTPGPLLWLTEIDDRSVLGLGDRVLDMPAEASSFLTNLLSATAPVRVGEMDGLDDDSRSNVVERLMAEGVLAPVDG